MLFACNEWSTANTLCALVSLPSIWCACTIFFPTCRLLSIFSLLLLYVFLYTQSRTHAHRETLIEYWVAFIHAKYAVCNFVSHWFIDEANECRQYRDRDGSTAKNDNRFPTMNERGSDRDGTYLPKCSRRRRRRRHPRSYGVLCRVQICQSPEYANHCTIQCLKMKAKLFPFVIASSRLSCYFNLRFFVWDERVLHTACALRGGTTSFIPIPLNSLVYLGIWVSALARSRVTLCRTYVSIGNIKRGKYCVQWDSASALGLVWAFVGFETQCVQQENHIRIVVNMVFDIFINKVHTTGLHTTRR